MGFWKEMTLCPPEKLLEVYRRCWGWVIEATDPAEREGRFGILLGLEELVDRRIPERPPLTTAPRYIARGWAVLACRAGGKAPLTAHGVHDATKDLAQIREWWLTWPEANIGIATGAVSGLVVLDVDERAGGLRSLETLQEKYGPLPRTPTVSTPGGGFHYYFRHPGWRVPNRPLPGYPGLEVKGDGGYVVAPPSRREEGEYWWWDSPERVEISPPPPWLELVRPEGNGHRAPEPVPERIPEGRRNDTLFRLACSLRDKGFTEAEIEAHLGLVNRQRCDPPLPEAEIAEIARSACRYQPKRPITQERGQTRPPTESPPGPKPEKAPIPRADLADLATLGAPEEPESLPLLGRDGYIIKGWGHILAGLPKVGKTELLFACVREWVADGLKVLWLSEEEEYLWRHRAARYPDLPRGAEVVFGRGYPVEELLALAAGAGADVVIVDTVRTLLQIPDENDNSAVARALDSWEVALKGKTRIYVHHLRKSGGDHGVGVAGAGVLVGAADRIIELYYDPNVQTRRKLRVLSRIVSAPDLLYEQPPEGGLVALGTPAAAALKDAKRLVLEVLGTDWMTFQQIKEAIPEPRPPERLLRQALKAVVEEGLVERTPPEEKAGARYQWRWREPPAQPWLV